VPIAGAISEYIAYHSGTGLAGGSETRPRNIALMAIIKY
jgi:hypothetical protein